MNAKDKHTIYTLLKTADAYECGYTRDKFAGEPVFADDTVVECSRSELIETTVATSNNGSAAVVSIQPTAYSTTGLNKSNDSAVVSTSSTTVSNSITLDELNAKILRCTRCGLARTRNNVVPGMGVEHPQVLVIGEGPGHEEDMQGLPFVGKAGVLLDRMLAAIGLDRKTNCYIANIVKCRPPENRNPLPEEQAACFSFLEAQIHILKPKMILCMGKIAAEKLLNQQLPITQYHGHFFEYQGIPLMPTYHPSALLRNEQLKRPAWEDLKGFRRKLDEIEGNANGAKL
jgi:DNA polymerase